MLWHLNFITNHLPPGTPSHCAFRHRVISSIIFAAEARLAIVSTYVRPPCCIMTAFICRLIQGSLLGSDVASAYQDRGPGGTSSLAHPNSQVTHTQQGQVSRRLCLPSASAQKLSISVCPLGGPRHLSSLRNEPVASDATTQLASSRLDHCEHPWKLVPWASEPNLRC